MRSLKFIKLLANSVNGVSILITSLDKRNKFEGKAFKMTQIIA